MLDATSNFAMKYYPALIDIVEERSIFEDWTAVPADPHASLMQTILKLPLV